MKDEVNFCIDENRLKLLKGVHGVWKSIAILEYCFAIRQIIAVIKYDFSQFLNFLGQLISNPPIQ